MSIAKISNKTGISKTQIRRILKKLGIESRSNRTDNELENKILEDYNNGESSEKIAKKYNINPTTVCRIIKRLGGNIRPAEENKRKIYKQTFKKIKLQTSNQDKLIINNNIPNYNNNIFVYNGKEITAKLLSETPINDRVEISSAAFNYYRENGFPYPVYSKEERHSDFQNLIKSNANLINNELKNISNAGIKIFKHWSTHYFDVRSPKLLSLIDAFNDDDILKAVINNRMGITYKDTFNITGNMIIQGLRNGRYAFAASIFKPSVAKFVYDNYCCSKGRVLDISAGFGQRMMGAAASANISHYTGIDPWEMGIESLKRIHENEFKEFDVQLLNVGSEEMKLEESFDLCFSSPPFYNKEIYADSSAQAYSNRSFDEFIESWWLPTANGVYKALRPNKLFVLNMDEAMAKRMIESSSKMFTYIDNFSIKYTRSHMSKNSVDVYYILKKR